jgi:hypothetical protein
LYSENKKNSLPRKQWDKSKKDIPIESTPNSPFKAIPTGLLKTDQWSKSQPPSTPQQAIAAVCIQSPVMPLKSPKPDVDLNKPYYSREEMLKALEIAKDKVNHKSTDTGNYLTLFVF